MAERLRERIASTVAFHKGAEIPVTASFGVATYPETVREREKLFPTADKALYSAKADGRNCVRGDGATNQAAQRVEQLHNDVVSCASCPLDLRREPTTFSE